MNKSAKTVLILDDEINVRQSLADYFEDNEWHSIQAECAEEAFRVLKSESPAGVIVDIRLKRMSGDEFVRQACRKSPKTAFIFCTGSPVYDIPADLKKIPCVSRQVFRKPLSDIAELERVLIEQIQKARTEND